MHAEVKVATMLVQNNVPFALADELTLLFRDILSDSEIAQRYASRQTKTACIVSSTLLSSAVDCQHEGRSLCAVN